MHTKKTVQRYFIYLAYDGTAYHGWQIQPNGASVQECLMKAQYFITCCELPMRTVNELTPQGVRSLLLPKPNKKKVDERQLMLDFGE